MTLDLTKIYSLLPAVYRIRDAELAQQTGGMLEPGEAVEFNALLAIQGPLTAQQVQRLQVLNDKNQTGPLKALISIIAEQIEVLENSLLQAYDDQFIETCQQWVVPYIGDLVAVSGLHEFPNAPFSNRAFVADTLALRRRKGTVCVLEQLARDVSGWPANAVEYFQRLATTQYMNHVRMDELAISDIRGANQQLLNTPFDNYARTLEVRNIEPLRGKYNIPNIGIFLWRIGANTVTHAPAFQVDARRFLFDAIGRDMQLYTRPQTETEITQISGPLNVPMPISRLMLNYGITDYYGVAPNAAERSILIEFATPNTSPPIGISACDLSDMKDSMGHVIGWAHQPKNTIGIDPKLGRIAFPSSLPAPSEVYVNYLYGFSAPMGGGEYGRQLDTDADVTIHIPDDAATIQDALSSAVGRLTGENSSAIIEIKNNEYYFETPSLRVPDGKSIELRAAAGKRPVLALSGDMLVTGGFESSFTVNGLLITGTIVVPAKDAKGNDNQVHQIRISHCTLVPSTVPKIATAPMQHAGPRLLIKAANTQVVVDHSITGSLRATDECSVALCNSIIDALAANEVAYAGLDSFSAGGPVTMQNCTVIGKVHALRLDLVSNAIFVAEVAPMDGWVGPVLADQVQQGCVRFSYVPPGSQVPRRYRCHPSKSDTTLVRPAFTSLRFGDAAYCQLAAHSGSEILEGADDQAEMGAFHDLYEPQRVANLRGTLQEYLRFGLQAGIFFAS
ncbi:MAG TPA: hypothetical protein VMT56_04385 [Candidatus Bathyarchaeia archaeon]|nr:hypothetical protein [Candidatus Bathyarchaeia archaeon]